MYYDMILLYFKSIAKVWIYAVKYNIVTKTIVLWVVDSAMIFSILNNRTLFRLMKNIYDRCTLYKCLFIKQFDLERYLPKIINGV